VICGENNVCVKNEAWGQKHSTLFSVFMPNTYTFRYLRHTTSQHRRISVVTYWRSCLRVCDSCLAVEWALDGLFDPAIGLPCPISNSNTKRELCWGFTPIRDVMSLSVSDVSKKPSVFTFRVGQSQHTLRRQFFP